MKKGTIALTAAVAVLGVAIGSLLTLSNKNTGIDSHSAFIASADIEAAETVYLDDEAIALAEGSNTNSTLRAEALRACSMINEIRQANGLNPLIWDAGLENCAFVRSEEISLSFSHTRPNGRKWNTVNSRIQGGENLAYGFNSADEVVDGWMGSPTHADNILYGPFNRIAISIYEDGGVYYWAQEFGY